MHYLVHTFDPHDEPAWVEELAALLDVQAQQGWHFVSMGTRLTPVTQLNLSTQAQALWMEIRALRPIGQFLTVDQSPSRHLRIGLKGWVDHCVSLSAFNILRARLPRTTPYVKYQRAVSPVLIDRQQLQLVGLRRPYSIQCI